MSDYLDPYSQFYHAGNGYGAGNPDATLADNPWINNFATRGVLTGLGFLGETLGKPQQALFGVASGIMNADPGQALKSLANLIPFSDTLGITNTPGGLTEHRISGRDLLRQAGVVDSQDNWGNFAGGMALDLAADPLAWVRGPLGALTKAGEAAAKAGTLESSIAGRIASGQGGWLGIADRPWYAELIPGVGRQENAAVLGMGKYGQRAANALDQGWDAATRATLPGTDFSPLAWLRSSFEKGAGNVTGYGPIVDTFGKTVARDTESYAAAGRQAAVPIAYAQSEALNALQQSGMEASEAAKALRRASASQRELGEAYLPTNISPQQEQIIRKFSDFYDQTIGGVVDPQRAALQAVGGQGLEDSSAIWGHRYNPRAQADTGNKLMTQQKERSELISRMPGGEAQVESILSNPQFSGIANRKVAGQAHNGQAIQDYIDNTMVPALTQDILSEGQKQAARIQARGGTLSDEAQHLMTPEGAKALATDFANYTAHLDPKIGDRGYFYRQDPFLGASQYGVNLASQRAIREGTLNVLAKEGEDIGSKLTKATNVADVVSLKDAVEQLGMKGAEQELLKRTGLSSMDDLAGKAVDRKLVEKLGQELAGPKPPGSVSQAFSKLTSAFRYGVTVPWPANFVRNWTGELVNEAISGSSPIKNLTTATSYLNKTLTDPVQLAKAQKAYEAGIAQGVLGRSQVQELLGTGVTGRGDLAFNIAPQMADRSTLDVLKEWAKPITSDKARTDMGITRLADSAPPSLKKAAEYADAVTGPVRGYIGAMEQGHAFQNEATRLQQIMNLMEEGYSAKAAARKTAITQRDYSNLTPFEQGTMRNIVPFYNFSKQNLISQLSSMSENPGRYNAMLTAVNSGRSDDSFVPGWASSGTAIPLPGAPDGQQRFLGSLGLPAEDEAIGAFAALLSGHPIESIRRLASGSNPAIKTPFEMATGRQIFSGRDLQDLRPSPAVSAVLGDNQFSRGLTEAITGTPLSRVLSTTDRLANTERTGVLPTLLNLATGIRTVDVDQNQAASIAAKEMIQRLLLESGKFKKHEDVGVKSEFKDQQQEFSPELLTLMNQYKFLQQQAQQAAKQKAMVSQ